MPIRPRTNFLMISECFSNPSLEIFSRYCVTNFGFFDRRILQFQVESAVEEGLEKMLGLALGFPLLRAQALEAADNSGEFLLKRSSRNWDEPGFNQIRRDILPDCSSGLIKT